MIATLSLFIENKCNRYTVIGIVLTGNVLRRLDLSNMTHHRPLVRGKYYALTNSAQRRKGGYYHLHLSLL